MFKNSPKPAADPMARMSAHCPDIRKAVRTRSLQWSIVVKVNRAGRRSGLQQVRVHSPLPVWSGSLGKREG